MVADAGSGGFNPYGQPNPYGPPPGAPPAAAPYGPPPAGYGTPGPAPGGFGQPAPAPPGYGAPAQAPQPYGGPPAGGYGPPPAQPAFGGAPPGGGYDQPQGGYGQPQGGYGQPQGGYGQPQGGYGGPPAPYGAAGGFTPPLDPPYGGGALVPMGGDGQRGPIGKIRNPVVTIVISCICFIYALLQVWQMLNELKAFRGKDDLNPILFFVPILGYIELWKLNEKVLDAKRMAGVPNAQVASPVLYLFLAMFFLPGDLNEIWQAASGGQLPPPS
jgi:hypothetical protein